MCSNRIELARIRNLQKLRPGLGGSLQVATSRAAPVRQGTPQILLRDLNADIGATGVSAHGRISGDLTLKAATNAGRLNFTLDSNLAAAAVEARGNAELTGDYPSQCRARELQECFVEPFATADRLLDRSTAGLLDASMEGQLTVNGVLSKTDQLRAALRIPVFR